MQRYKFPGFIDLHVHFRDPGVPEAETTASGLAAAAAGGIAAVVVMPNTTPPIDSPAAVADQSRLAAAAPENPVKLFSSACITVGRTGAAVADLERLAEAGAVFFTDDGAYVRDAKVMEEAMSRAYELNRVISQHALAPGVTEAEAVRRDLALCRVTGCRLHIQHLSTAAGVELVRTAQREGLPVTAEATPHHLLLTADDIGVAAPEGYYRMAPPLATREDRAEVRRGVKDGVLMFATDHAPHPEAVKRVPYEKAANGIIGLETAIAVTYAVMVEAEGMSVENWAKAWYEMPRSLLPAAAVGEIRRETEIEVGPPRRVRPDLFRSRSRNCPYAGMEFSAWPRVLTHQLHDHRPLRK